MTLMSELCHVLPKISFCVLLVCSKLDWHKTQSLFSRFRQCGNTKDRQRSGCSRVTSLQQDNHIRLVYLRDRLQTSNLTARSIPGLRPNSSRTIRNIFCERHIRPRRPAIRPIVLPRHRAARLIPSIPSHRRTLCRRLRYSTSVIWWRQCYGLGRHNRVRQDTISCCHRTSDRNALSG